MAIKTIDDTHLKQIANAIREKTGSAEGISVDEMPEQIKGIEGSTEPALQDKTVTPTTSSQTITADSGYDGLDTVTVNAMPTATQATPSITISSAGLITASATQTAGYVSAGTKSATKQLTTQAAKTVTPTKSSQTAIASGRYTTGAITVAAIPAQYITTTDATAAAADLRTGKTAYVNGSKVTGTVEDFDGSYTCSGESTGGGSGGGSVETCTVTTDFAGCWFEVIYITYDNGSYNLSLFMNSENTNGFQLVNVLKGSDIIVYNGESFSGQECTNAELIESIETSYGVVALKFTIHDDATIIV